MLRNWVLATTLLLGLPGCSSDITGAWGCITTNPNTSVSRDTWTFGSDHSFRIRGESDPLNGRYMQTGKKITITITEIPSLARYGTSTSANVGIEATILSLGQNKLEIDTVTQYGTRRKILCSRI